jgi:hypothetical protein
MRCGRLLRGVTTGACDVQGVVSGETRSLLPLRDRVVVEVEGCDVAMSTKLRSCRAREELTLVWIFLVSAMDVIGVNNSTLVNCKHSIYVID